MIRRVLWLGGSVAAAVIAMAVYILYPPPQRVIAFPDGKTFAFSIVDDTDMATLERAQPLYDVLYRYGLRTTKTVWVRESTELEHSPNNGDSLQDPDYRAFIIDLKSKGFEIALHGVRGGSSLRTDILPALDEFRALLGEDPRIHINHSLNRENVYWGPQRWSFSPYRWLYTLVGEHRFQGEDPSSEYFWGDVLRERIAYVNQFTFSEINLLEVAPSFPYHLPDKPLVNLWFPTANGNNLDEMEKLLTAENLDRLAREGGVCIVYTHLASGSFNANDGGADPRFVALISEVAQREGWFAPASDILDYLKSQSGWRQQPSWRERVRLETLFLWDVITST